MTLVLSGDVGGTRIKLGLVDAASGQVLARATIPAEAAGGLAARLPAIAAAWTECLHDAGVAAGSVHHAALGLPCAISADGRRVLGTPASKFADAPSLDLAGWATASGWTLRLENDARCALAGELAFGALRGSAHAALVTLGTGIGVAVACDGRLLRGAGQATLMFGHLPQESGPACICGRAGCAEAQAGGWAFARDGQPWPGPQREHALTVWTRVLDAIATAYDPALIAVGGGLAAADPTLVAELSARLAACPRLAGPAPAVVAAALGEAGPLLGAARIALETT